MKLLTALLFLPLLAFGQAYSFRDPTVQFPATASAPLTLPTFVRAGTNSSASATTLTIAAFSVTGSNPYLIVGVNERSSLTVRTPSVTANGVAMTQLVGTNYTDTKGTNVLFGLANPTTGDIVVTLSGSANAGFAVNALLFNGCATVGAAAADYSAAGRTSVSVAPASVATDLVVDILATGAWTAGGSQVVRSTTTTGQTSSMSTLTGSAGTATMSWSGSSAVISQVAIVLHGL